MLNRGLAINTITLPIRKAENVDKYCLIYVNNKLFDTEWYLRKNLQYCHLPRLESKYIKNNFDIEWLNKIW